MRSRFKVKLTALERWLVLVAGNRHRHLVVNEFPKSGGTWLGQLLSAYLALPFPRNARPNWAGCILHTHTLAKVRHRTIIIWRDGRDVMTSWYFHCLFNNEIENAALVREVTRESGIMNPEDTLNNMHRFIEHCFTQAERPPFDWAQFVQHWHERDDVLHTSYEVLRRTPCEELSRLLKVVLNHEPDEALVNHCIEAHHFDRSASSNGTKGGKTRFLRRGIIGDWKNHFSRQAAQVFDHYAGEQLILLGYEQDNDWVNKVNEP